ncbi:ribonuclease III domain-containing protein [Fervidobacterium sp.]|uniref:Mini-ribonuclease 3 n=1 Tax=Fervidobacterium sp. TaxID=1871331 RepID=UPI0025BFCF6F|nr:ribonuclease III domain-containing protein [Fervidobacterium sp.]
MPQEMSKEEKNQVQPEMFDIFPEPSVNAEELSSDALAYLGDAVYNLYIKLCVLKDIKARDLHRLSNIYVSREGQSKALEKILPILTEKEKDIVRRGMNSKSARKHGNDRLYIKSTGFEALVGYLYLTDRNRLRFLLREGIKWEEV